MSSHPDLHVFEHYSEKLCVFVAFNPRALGIELENTGRDKG
jgi:hypothetical protein